VLCDCGGTLRNKINFDRLQQLPTVKKVVVSSHFCSPKECKKTIRAVSTKKVDRIVIGACDREIFEGALKQAVAGSGINPGLLWCVNIREHCGWVTGGKKAATDRAVEIVTAALRRIKFATKVKSKKVTVNQDVLVIGGGVGAMQTASALAGTGHRVNIVTDGKSLDGQAAKSPDLYGYIAHESRRAATLVQKRIDELIEKVNKNKRIELYTETKLLSLDGRCGNFTATIGLNGSEKTLAAGAVVLASGAAASPLADKWAELVGSGRDVPDRIAIVMDSLGEQGPDVSAQVLSAAEQLIERFGAEVKIYCHNIRLAATGLEALYRRARQAGAVVIKYDDKPVITSKGSTKTIRTIEPAAGVEVEAEFDLVISADAAEPEISKFTDVIRHLRAGPEGVLQADNVWLLPTKSNLEGISVIGRARRKNELRAAQTDALAAAGQIHQLLKDKKIEVLDDAASVDAEKCVLCLSCLRICPCGAIDIDIVTKAASVSALTCQRCGICVALCPAGAIELPGYMTKQLAAEVADRPKLTVFACENSAFPAATAAAAAGCGCGENVRLIRVPCAGRVDAREILRCLQNGTEKVLVLGCHPDSCKYINGSSRAVKTIMRIENMLQKARIEKERVVFGPLASVEPKRFLEYVKE